MGIKARIKMANKTREGLRYPATVLYDVEQYRAIDSLEIDGCRGFGAKVRALVAIGLDYYGQELHNNNTDEKEFEQRIKAARAAKASEDNRQ